jgi:hypothetical protein
MEEPEVNEYRYDRGQFVSVKLGWPRYIRNYDEERSKHCEKEEWVHLADVMLPVEYIENDEAV